MKKPRAIPLDFVIDKLTNSIELNIELIGGQGPLTKLEEKIISDFLNSRLAKKRAGTRKKKVKQMAT